MRREETINDQKYLTKFQVLVETMREQILFKQNESFVEVITTQQRHIFKREKKIRRNLVQLVVWTDNELNVLLANILDADL